LTRVIEGKAIADIIREEIQIEVANLKSAGIQPRLNALLVGDDPASEVYARAKEKSCNRVGIDFELAIKPASVSATELLELITAWNKDQRIQGIIIELPLPKGLDKNLILEAVDPLKDVDGAHPLNRGRLLGAQEGLYPATPQSCIEILLRQGIEISGKNAVLVGRGETVGKPLIYLLLNQNATVTVCHTGTKNLAYHTREADILIAAAGRAKMITAEMIKPGAIVVDAGINPMADDGICGDVDFAAALAVAGAITPVPGGVGSLTTVMVQKNLLKAIKLQGLKSVISG